MIGIQCRFHQGQSSDLFPTLFDLQLSTFQVDDEHKQRHEEAQEVNFSIGRPKAALLRELQPNHCAAAAAVDEGEEERVQVKLGPKAALVVDVDEATSGRKPVAARSPPPGPTGPSGTGVNINTEAAAAAAAAKRGEGEEEAAPAITPYSSRPETPPLLRPRLASRGEFREYGAGEFSAMIARRARSFERDTGAGAGHRSGGLSGQKKRDSSWDRKWRDEQERNR